MSVHVKPELSVGQLLVIFIAVLSVLGTAWTTIAEVRELKRESLTYASTESVTSLKEDVKSMKDDIRDIRNFILGNGSSLPTKEQVARLDSLLHTKR